MGITVLSGCMGVTQNPSRIGNLPNGDIVQTHAKPPLRGYWRDFDPAAKTLTVTPNTSIGQVGTQHVIVASVCDDDGDGRRRRRVEWHISGAGHFVEVDESGLFPGRGYLVDNQYGVSYTNYNRQTITRGNSDPSDDIQLRPGQTFCVVYSPVEGETKVTAYAPGIYDWQEHKTTVTKYWVDAQPIFPPPAVNRTGEAHALTTRIVRSSDGSGASGYRIRYRILDGPPAVFEPGGAPAVEVISDSQGNGSTMLRQVTPAPGVNRIQIEVVRPGDTPTAREILISSHVTTKTWVAPNISIQKIGPTAAAVGAQIPFRIIVTNTGSVATQGLTIRDSVPQGISLVGTNPPATVQGENVLWNFGPLGAGQSVAVELAMQASQPGTLVNNAEAGTPEGLFARASSTTQVQTGALTISKTGPPSAVVGEDVTFQVTVGNNGTAPAVNVVLVDQFEGGLVHPSGQNVLQMPVGVLGPGESRLVPITLRAGGPGRACNRVTAQAEGGLAATAEHCLEISQPQLSITKSGPQVAFVGSTVDFAINVRNTGGTPATNVVVQDQLPPALQPIEASQGAVQGQNVLWNLATLGPGEERTLNLRARAIALGQEVCNSAIVSAAGIANQQSAPACLEIRGIPGVRSEIIDDADPVPVGSETTFTIKITNQGSMPLTNLVVEGEIPDGMTFVDAEGATSTLPAEFDERQRKVRFQPFQGLPTGAGMAPGSSLFYRVKVRADRPGDKRFRMIVNADQLKSPVSKEESTQIFDPATGALNGSASRIPLPPIPTEPVIEPAGATVPDDEIPFELKPVVVPEIVPPPPAQAPTLLPEAPLSPEEEKPADDLKVARLAWIA